LRFGFAAGARGAATSRAAGFAAGHRIPVDMPFAIFDGRAIEYLVVGPGLVRIGNETARGVIGIVDPILIIGRRRPKSVRLDERTLPPETPKQLLREGVPNDRLFDRRAARIIAGGFVKLRLSTDGLQPHVQRLPGIVDLRLNLLNKEVAPLASLAGNGVEVNHARWGIAGRQQSHRALPKPTAARHSIS
jgi:hypothetical protein